MKGTERAGWAEREIAGHVWSREGLCCTPPITSTTAATWGRT